MIDQTSIVQPEISGFRIALNNFEGPLDFLLQLISSKKLDVTEVALAEVTDEFIDYVKYLSKIDANGNQSKTQSVLNETTEFLLVAATLLDLKTNRLLPYSEEEEEGDAELFDARDLLFARLLQYQAYKKVADFLDYKQRYAQRRYPKEISVEDRYKNLLPPVNIGIGKEEFSRIAAIVFRPRSPEEIMTDHIRGVLVSVPEQTGKILDFLYKVGKNTWVDFSDITQSCTVSLEVIGRFLGLLELYRVQAINVSQESALEKLSVSWTGMKVDPSNIAATDWI